MNTEWRDKDPGTSNWTLGAILVLLALAAIIFLALARPVQAVGGWTVIWEGDFLLDETAGVYEGYFLADRFYGNWPAGLLRQEVRVEYLGKAPTGGVISFHAIRFPPECGMSLWSIGSYMTTPATYHYDVRFFGDAPNGTGIVYDGRGAKGPCRAKVNMRLLTIDRGVAR